MRKGGIISDAHAVIADAGISDVAVALFYQVGYLIIPALAPVVIWVLFNRPYIEQLAGLVQQQNADSGD